MTSITNPSRDGCISGTTISDAASTRSFRNDEPVIQCRDVWKIYTLGKAPQKSVEDKAISLIKEEGVDKAKLLSQLGCVVGVAGVSFEVKKGECFCLMGLSGSGKSTLLRHLNRLIEPSSGEILVNGRDISKGGFTELQKLRLNNFGMVFQNVALWPHRNVRDNISYGLEILGQPKALRTNKANELLNLVKLDGWGDRYPDELSGGMRQRVGLARALATDPPILLLDEPFSALDPLIRQDLREEFKDLIRKLQKTAVFVTHDLDEAIDVGDRIAIMMDGEITQIGIPEEIVTNPINSYVKKFVAGVSRLNLVKAGTVMRPLTELGVTLTPGEDRYKKVNAEATLGEVIECAISSDLPVLVENRSGHIMGGITRKILLSSLKPTL